MKNPSEGLFTPIGINEATYLNRLIYYQTKRLLLPRQGLCLVIR